MHGTVTHALREMICFVHGFDKWQKISEVASLDQDAPILASKNYDDAVILRLLHGAAEVLGKTPGTLLQEFGRYWIVEVTSKRYGGLMNACGANFEEFMRNMPEFHDRIMLLYPEIRPPEFEVQAHPNGDMLISYRSSRDGMHSFVVGILEGICIRFQLERKVETVRLRSSTNEADLFLIRSRDAHDD